MPISNSDGALYFATGIDNSGLISGKQKALGILKGFASQVSRFDVFAGLGVGAGIALSRAGKELEKFSQQYEQAMREVMTISAAVQSNYQGFADSVMDLSTELPQSAIELSKAYYQIVSAGYDGAAGLKLLEVSGKAAVGGVTDVTTAADGLTTVLNAWQLSADQSSRVADTFFATVRLGKTTFGELASSMSMVAPLASAYNVSFEEIAGSLATLTKQGTPTSVAMTQLRQALISVNEEFGQGWRNTFTFQEALEEIALRAETSGRDVKEFTGRVEGALAILGLTGKNAKVAAEDIRQIGESAGAATGAFNDMIVSSENQSKIFKNNIQSMLQPLGDFLSGKSTDFKKFMNQAFDSGKIEQWAKMIAIATTALIAYSVATKAASITKMQFLRTIVSVRRAIMAMNASMLASPIGILAAALTAATTAFVAFRQKSVEATRASKEFFADMAQQKRNMDGLFTQLKNVERGTDAHKDAINRINEKYGPYLTNLLSEKSTLEEIETAHKLAQDAMVSRIAVAAQEAAMQEAITDSINEQATAAEKLYKHLEKKIGPDAAGIAIAGFDSLAEEFTKRYNETQKALHDGNMSLYEQLFSALSSDVSKWSKDLAGGEMNKVWAALADVRIDKNKLNGRLEEIKRFYQAFVKEMNEGLTVDSTENFVGPLPFDYDGLFAGMGDENYYDKLLKKISETEDALKALSGEQGTMDIAAINQKRELLIGLNAEKEMLELLLGLKEKEQKIKAEDSAPTGSIAGQEAILRDLREKWKNSTDQITRDTLLAAIQTAEAELEIMKGAKEDEILMVEDFYQKIDKLRIRDLMAEKQKLQTEIAEKKKAFETADPTKKKSLIAEIDEAQQKIGAIDNQIRRDLSDAVSILSSAFSGVVDILGEIDSELGEMAGKVLQAAEAGVQLGVAIATGDPVAIASAGISLVTSLVKLYGEAGDATKEYADELERVNQAIERQQRLIDTDRSGNQIRLMQDKIKLQQQYVEALKEQIEYEQSTSEWDKKSNFQKWLAATFPFLLALPAEDITPELEKELEDATNLLEDWQTDLADALAGGITQADMASIIADELRAAGGHVQDFGNVTQRILQDAVLGAFESAVMAKGLTEMQNYLSGALADNILTDQEREAFESMAETYASQWNAVAEQLNFGALFGQDQEDPNSLAGGIRRELTEETGSILAGSMNAIRLDVRDIALNQGLMIDHLSAIERNTSFNRNLEGINNKMDTLLGKIENYA